MAASTTLILAALRDELSPVIAALQLTTYDGLWIGEASSGKVVARYTGFGAARSVRALAELAEAHRPARVLTIGFAAGLDPQLAGGDAVEPRWIIDGKGGAYMLDPHAARPPALGGDGHDRPAHQTLLTVTEPVHTPEEKRRLFARARASLADMETFTLAGEAARRGLPLVSIRAVSDPADTALPPQALSWVTPEGLTNAAAATRFAMTHPGWMGTLMKLGRYARRGADQLAQRVLERLKAS